MKAKWKVIGIGLVATSLMSATVYGRPGFRRGGHGMIPHRVLKALDLTAEQQDKVNEIKTAHRQRFRELFSQLRTVRREMAGKLFSPGDVTAESMANQVQEVTNLRGQITQEGLTVALKVRALLTSEQLARSAEISERMRELRAEMRSLYDGSK
jgi:Spy/CpxP family protein refolding chaperone